MNKQVVYTCITGGYDRLREPKYVSPSIDYICFTDNAKLTSNFWKIRQLPSDLKNLTDVKKQRLIKVLPHKYLSEYDVSLWVDSNIEIVGDLKDFFNKYDLSQKFLYTNKHPSRDCLYREQIAVLRLKKDTYENTNPQIERYREEGFPEHYGLAETNIILRAHKNQKCKTLMNLWGEEILNGSHRDQLSFNYAIWKTGTKDYVEYLDEKYYNLHLSDNNFFKLATHIKADSFERFKTIDTNPPPEPEPIEEEEKTEEEYHEEESLPIVEEESKKAILADPICVVMFTHNRTHVAKAVIKSLVRNIVYPNIKWIISDDRSNPGHVEDICDLMRQMKISPIVCRTDSKRWGLGASMNNGLREAFKHSDIVLRTEDDWYLEKKLYLEPMVDLLKKNNETAGIRLGMVGKGVGTDSKITLAKGYKSLTGGKSSWIFNNQVMLVHKRTHDLLGWYKENVGADAEETEFKDRFNKKTDSGKKKLHLFCPNSMKWETLDDPSLWFIHVGRSTLGHQIYREPARYSWIYKVNDPKKAKEIKEKRKEEQRVLDNKAVDKILKIEKKEEPKKEEKEPKKVFKPQQKEIKLNPTVIVEKQKKQEKEIEKIVVVDKPLNENFETECRKVSFPDISVMITTHNRTNIICAVIDSLCKNLSYSGAIHWIISDDRSNLGHLETIKKQLVLNEIDEKQISILKTDSKRFGLGASLNNGLKEAFKYGDVVLTTEDDWILHRELNLDSYVKTISNNSIAAIRLACLRGGKPRISKKFKEFFTVKEFEDIPNNYIFNNQVALRHKRIYDKLGYYLESADNNLPEKDMSERYNRIIKPNETSDYVVLFPRELRIRTIDHPTLYFIHVGKSTIGNAETVPTRYEYLYEPMTLQNISERRKISKKNLYIVSNQLDSNVNEPKDSLTFFRYLQKNGIPSKYLISAKHVLAESLKKEKDVVLLNNPMDKEEFLQKCSDALIHCKVYISEGTACNPEIFRFFQISTIKTVFMDHGIVNNWGSRLLANLMSKCKFLNVSSEQEKQTVRKMIDKFGFKQPGYIIGGLPRFDVLKDLSNKEKNVMVMFSCRPSLTREFSKFSRSLYLKNLLSLVSKLDKQVSERKIDKVFLAIHHQFVNRIPKMLDFFKEFKNIEIVDSNKISNAIEKSSILLTDVSSVSFDFFFLKKPVVFWALDMHDKELDSADFEKILTSKTNIKNSLFNVVESEEELLKLLDFYISNGMTLETEKIEKTECFFKHKKDICENLYTAIETL